MHHSNPLSRKNQVLDSFCREKSQVLCLDCQEVAKSWLYSAQSDPRLGHSLGRETQDLGFLWAETPKSWFFSVNRNLRDRLWSVLLAALYFTWSDSESGLGLCLTFFWISPDGPWRLSTGSFFHTRQESCTLRRTLFCHEERPNPVPSQHLLTVQENEDYMWITKWNRYKTDFEKPYKKNCICNWAEKKTSLLGWKKRCI